MRIRGRVADVARRIDWAHQPQEFFERAIVDLDGHTVNRDQGQMQ